MKRSGDLRRAVVVICIASLIAGCGLLSKTTKTTNESAQSESNLTGLKTSAKTHTIADAKHVKFHKDSVDANYSIQFWPKGRLIFLPDGGFSGEFDSVQVKGNVSKLSQSAEFLNLKKIRNSTNDTELKTQHQLVASAKQVVKKTFPSWIFIVAGVVIVLVFAIKLIN